MIEHFLVFEKFFDLAGESESLQCTIKKGLSEVFFDSPISQSLSLATLISICASVPFKPTQQYFQGLSESVCLSMGTPG